MDLGPWAIRYKRGLVAICLIPVVVALLRFALIEAYPYALDAHKRGAYSSALPIVWGNVLFADPGAAGLLGVMYLFGQGVERNGVRAEYWLGKAAEAGVIEAQSLLGTMYATGQGVPRNPERARYWLTRASAGGDREATQLLKAFFKSQAI